MRVTIHLLDLDGPTSHPLHLRLPCSVREPIFHLHGSDYDLVLLPPNVDVDAISKALSSLRLVTNEGQVLKNDHLGGS
jgi:hypothetical protein